MAAGDARVGLGPLLRVFGVSATVTRPDDTPVATTVIWVTEGFAVPVTDASPFEAGLQRREPHRILAVPTSAGALPKGTVISAPELKGQAAREWRVDSTLLALPDERRVLVLPVE